MNLRQIREECWDIARELDTPDKDRLWPLAEINRYINRVYRQIARDCKCIRDSTTPEICIINSDVVDYTTYVAGTLDYIWANDPSSWLYHLDVCPYLEPLNPLILDIDEVKWMSRDWRLVKVSSQKWQQNMRWEQVVGLPTEYATDLQNKMIALNYRADVSGILQLVVKRMPLLDLADDDDEPEFRANYHDFFRNGVLEQMYSKQDADAYDLEKASSYGAKFKKDITEIKEEETKINERLMPNHPMEGHM